MKKTGQFTRGLLGLLLGLSLANRVASAQYLFIDDGNAVDRFDISTSTLLKNFIAAPGASGLAVGPDGNLYVARSDAQVFRYDPITGTQIGAGPFIVGNTVNPTDDQLGRPAGMAFGPNGDLYIGDLYASTVREFDNTGSSVRQFTGVSRPTDIAFDSAGNLVVIDPENRSILKSEGAIAPFSRIAGFTEIDNDLTVGRGDNIYVGSWYAYSLNIYDESGNEIGGKSYEDPQSGTGFSPDGLAFGPDGKLYAADYAKSEIGRLLPDGTFDGIVVTGLSYLQAQSSLPRFLTFVNIPEPASMAILGFAAAISLLRRRDKFPQ